MKIFDLERESQTHLDRIQLEMQTLHSRIDQLRDERMYWLNVQAIAKSVRELEAQTAMRATGGL